MTQDDLTDDQHSVDLYVRRLAIEHVDDFVFRATDRREGERIFGGMLLARAVAAATQTVAAGAIHHSLHAYFVKPGKPDTELRYTVTPIRDGRTFLTRRVTAAADGEALCEVLLTFAREDTTVSRDDRAVQPLAPTPDDLEPFDPPESAKQHRELPFEIRRNSVITREDSLGTEFVWLRLRAPLPDRFDVRAAALVAISDMFSNALVEVRHGIPRFSPNAPASLDYALWVLRPARLDGWILLATRHPVSHDGGGLIVRDIFEEGAGHVATMTQDVVILRPPEGP